MFPALCAFRLALDEVMLTDHSAEETDAALQLWKQIQQQDTIPVFVLIPWFQLHDLCSHNCKEVNHSAGSPVKQRAAAVWKFRSQSRKQLTC